MVNHLEQLIPELGDIWPVVIVVIIMIALSLSMHLIKESNDEKRVKRRKEESDKEEQENYRKQMVDLGENSLSLFESMPKNLSSAEIMLDQAEVDFAEGAFAPFGDSVEKAANQLARFNQNIHAIRDDSSCYTVLVQKYAGAPPKFSLTPQSIEKMGVSTITVERMTAIVRTAQRDFQFATIYEQRKTNKILVKGFHSLAQALENMTDRIVASLDELGISINTMASTVDEAIDGLHSELDDITKMSNQHYEESSAREKEALKMLDNIQRRRGPRP